MSLNSKSQKSFLCNFRLRSKIIFGIEQYFQEREYIALHTPAMFGSLIPEQHIDAFEIAMDNSEIVVDDGQHSSTTNTSALKKKYLVPSPELGIKTLLAHIGQIEFGEQAAECAQTSMSEHTPEQELASATSCVPPNVYEISHSFRNGEVEDRIHNSEFMMLEWYTYAANLQDSMDVCNELIVQCARKIDNNVCLDLFIPKVYSMEDAFAEFAHLDLIKLIACDSALTAAEYAGLTKGLVTEKDWENYDWSDVFHRILLETVEPKLPHNRPVYLTHYPDRIETLAKSKNDIWAERWELYIGGIEIANCYVEETDAERIAKYTKLQLARIRSKRYPRKATVLHNEQFLQEVPLPPYSGVALGLDRLVLSLLKILSYNVDSLGDVSPLAWLQDNKNDS